jgi:hypothetical protein
MRPVAVEKREPDDVGDNPKCDCCKAPSAVDETGLCFECVLIRESVSIIKDETDLSEDDAFELAYELQAAVMPAIIERLPKSPPLLAEILRTWALADTHPDLS